jgi:tetratricopeptide (TPR) repeat protein
VVTELAPLERALTTADFAKQREPLESILKALKPLKLSSIEQLDMNTRGRLLTTLLRVQRQSKPPPAPAPAPAAEGAPAAEAAPPAPEAEATTEAPPSESPPPAVEPEAPAADAAPPPADAAAPTAETAPPAQGDAAPVEAAAAAAAAETPSEPKPPAPPPVDEKIAAWQEVMFLVGSVWRAIGDERRAALAFAQSGRRADQREAVKTLAATGDWQEQAKVLTEQGRTRDAARLYERNKSFADAARLFEAGNDAKSALRSLLLGKDFEGARKIMSALKPIEWRPILEKAQAWELLMEHSVKSGDFGEAARLYERAKQFDQAALAWERAGKLPSARKAYERAKDAAGAERIRALEVAELVKRGDRLGAATLLLSGSKRQEAIDLLLALPPPKAFHFLQRVKLDEEAVALAKREIDAARKDNRASTEARWLEQLGEPVQAGEAWERAARRDKALALYEQAGQWARSAALAEALGQLDKAVELFHRAGDEASAARVAALPRPAPSPGGVSAEGTQPSPAEAEPPSPEAEPSEQRNQ